ncbi:MAG: cob(I)yrinic acid a,c-diamide adenosyltransferase [Spirochaetaceae bacterium]
MIQIYTGDGKGKTTAAIGLAVRAAGHGRKSFLGQFLKGRPTGEIQSLSQIEEITIEQFGGPEFILPGSTDEKASKLAERGLRRAEEALESGGFYLVILDELNVALSLGVLPEGPVREFLDRVPEEVELICTGRDAPAWLIERADLVTEMRALKHYADQGVRARRGIEY